MATQSAKLDFPGEDSKAAKLRTDKSATTTHSDLCVSSSLSGNFAPVSELSMKSLRCLHVSPSIPQCCSRAQEA